VSELQLEPESPPIILGTARPKKHHHEDAYESLPGAVANVKRGPEEPAPPTRANLALAADVRADQEMRAARYDRYLEALASNMGDAVAALAEAFEITQEQARANQRALHAEVRSGSGGSDIAPILERADLDIVARVRVLRQHVYSNVPAASLKAIDMLSEMEGSGGNVGSFEQYLRLAKARKGA
jgi:hypothetical protein